MASKAISGLELSSRGKFERVNRSNANSALDPDDDIDDDESSVDGIEDITRDGDQHSISVIIQDLKVALLAARYVFLILLCLSLLLMYQFTIAPYLIDPMTNQNEGIVNTPEKLVCSPSTFLVLSSCHELILMHSSQLTGYLIFYSEICETCIFRRRKERNSLEPPVIRINLLASWPLL